jgi:hypothetical protein
VAERSSRAAQYVGFVWTRVARTNLGWSQRERHTDGLTIKVTCNLELDLSVASRLERVNGPADGSVISLAYAPSIY